MNEQNLIKKEDRTPSERRESASRAGKASGESRRRKRDARSLMKLILSLTPDTEDWNVLSASGVPMELIDNKSLLLLSLYQKAITGDVQATKLVLTLSGDLSGLDEREQKARIKKLEAEVRRMSGDTGDGLRRAAELLGGLPDGLDG